MFTGLTTNIDITVMVNAHREGQLLGPALRSAQAAVAVAEADQCRCEILVILDRSDEETRAVAEAVLGPDGRSILVDVGDPSRARNIGVEHARGRTLALLDGDDMFGSAWLATGFACLRRHDFGNVCVHPEYTLIFGEEKVIWHHLGMEDPDFRLELMMFENYFAALSFAPTDQHRRFPFLESSPEMGFGHEDWAWVRETMHYGMRHLVVPGTLQAVRRRRTSRLVTARLHQHLPIPTPLFSGRDLRIP